MKISYLLALLTMLALELLEALLHLSVVHIEHGHLSVLLLARRLRAVPPRLLLVQLRLQRYTTVNHRVKTPTDTPLQPFYFNLRGMGSLWNILRGLELSSKYVHHKGN